MRLLTLQLFNNSTDTQEKLRLNLHSLSVWAFRIRAIISTDYVRMSNNNANIPKKVFEMPENIAKPLNM